jgi:integrase
MKKKTKQTQANQTQSENGNQKPLNIVNVMLWMKKNAYEETTIRKTAKLLRHLQKHCNTTEAEEVKLYISRKPPQQNGYKENLIEAYDKFMQSQNFTWEKPFYKRYSKKRRAPKEELVDFLIEHCRIEMAMKLAISKDLGQRPQELCWLTLKDIDLCTGIVSITGAKHTIGREGKLRTNALELLKIYIEKRKLNPSSHIYNGKSDSLSDNYRRTRNRIATKYNMPELKQIQLYDFRRFKATKAYRLSGNSLIHVKELLGHKDIRQTEHYISVLGEAELTWTPIKAVTDEEKAKCIAEDCVLVANDNGAFWFKKPA